MEHDPKVVIGNFYIIRGNVCAGLKYFTMRAHPTGVFADFQNIQLHLHFREFHTKMMTQTGINYFSHLQVIFFSTTCFQSVSAKKVHTNNLLETFHQKNFHFHRKFPIPFHWVIFTYLQSPPAHIQKYNYSIQRNLPQFPRKSEFEVPIPKYLSPPKTKIFLLQKLYDIHDDENDENV